MKLSGLCQLIIFKPSPGSLSPLLPHEIAVLTGSQGAHTSRVARVLETHGAQTTLLWQFECLCIGIAAEFKAGRHEPRSKAV